MLQEIYDFTMNLKVKEYQVWKYVYKINRLFIGILYPFVQFFNHNIGIDSTSEIIVSLTSYPGRIKGVWVTVASLLNQSKKPYKVILWLAQSQFPNGESDLPKRLVKLKERGLEIRFCEDLKSHKKYFYAMQEYEDKYIITFDDDMIYPTEQVERLWKKHLEYPDCVVCHYGHAISFDIQGEIEPYRKWIYGDKGYCTPSSNLMPVGCNGVLYPPKCLPKEAFDIALIKDTCWSCDDLWLKCMSIMNGFQAVSCNEGAMLCFGLLYHQKNALYHENADGDRNDKAINKITAIYPQLLQKLSVNIKQYPYMKIIVAHPGKQHSLRLAEGLERSGILYRYITTMYDKKRSLTHFALHFLKGNDKKKAAGRKNEYLPEEKVITMCEMTGLIGRLLDRLLPYPRVYYTWNDYMNRCFAKKVARYAIRNKVDAVISYDNNSDLLFNILKRKAPDIIRILDVSSMNRIYMKQLYEADMKVNGHRGFIEEQYNLWNNNTIDRLDREIKNTQYFIVPSETVKESYIYSGVKEDQIQKVPYGVDTAMFTFHKRNYIHEPLRLIYVGNVGYKKGCHHLLKIVSELGKEKVILSCAGSRNKQLYEKYKYSPNINWLGFVTRDILNSVYAESDVYIMTSVGEGMAMSGIEALACGLPVICTNRSGVNDAIVNGQNGFVVEAGNDSAMKIVIEHLIANPDIIKVMNEEARKTAQQYTWENYYDNISTAVKKIIYNARNI